jgi:hypothetical protein
MAVVPAWQTMPRWMTICTRHLRRWSGLTALIVGLLMAATALHVTSAGSAPHAAAPGGPSARTFNMAAAHGDYPAQPPTSVNEAGMLWV